MCMSKVRVYELARDIGIESKELVDFLAELGAEIKNHMSTIEPDIAAMVREHFQGGSKSESPAQTTPDAPSPTRTDPTNGTPQRDSNEAARKSPPSGSHGKTAPPKSAPKSSESRKDAGRGTLIIPDSLTVKEFADKLGVPATAMIRTLMGAGIMAGINQSIDHEAASTVARKLGFQVERPQAQKIGLVDMSEDSPEELVARAPIVTIMGHVDHGKTTLLDTIRKARVAEKEAGGITQHVGAYQVEYEGKRVSFIDTPGHEAFTAMRSRGAQLTDIAILVVAADDGVMPQTLEAINHAKAAKVPIIVAVNKMDRPTANPDRIKQQLSEHDLVPEDWGGDTIYVPISALHGEGIDDLLEMILLVAELGELTANPNRPANGTVIEAELDKGRGPVATVLVRNGTLRIGDSIVAGSIPGKVRALFDDTGRSVREAGPSVPVEVLGFTDVPNAGDVVEVLEDDRTARLVATERAQEQKDNMQRHRRVRLAELFSQIQSGDVKDLYVLVKADVQGSIEALQDSLEKLSTDQVRVNVIHGAVGGITESDVNLAAASNAIIIGFNVRPETTARSLAEREGVEINLYRVIYEAIHDVEQAIEGLLDPVYEEVVLGRAEVRATFKVPGAGTVAGCYVSQGRILRNAEVRVLRDNIVIFEGKIASLKRFKDDVREVNEGYECGIGVERFNDIKEGDVIEAFRMEEVS